ncbi:MAG: thymidylate synthase [Chthoniobacteraceae bacterium]
MNAEPLVIKASGIVDAWRLATEQILEGGERFNLSVHITNPAVLDETEVGRCCHRRVAPDIRQSVYDVANTIFPKDSLLHQADPQAFFAHYQPLYERGQRRHPTTWGTYFLRLVSFGVGDKNQLSKIVEAMKNWNAKPRAAFVLHLSSAELDNPRLRGGPCWQYGQFIRTGDEEMSLVAVYRSHDYFQKALGNFVGLNRLLRFVCHHAGMKPGTLTCLSTFAHLQAERTKTRQLLSIT